jgi:hypothetical protein
MSARWTLKRGELRFFDFRRGRPVEWRRGELRFFDSRRGTPLEWSSKPWRKID